MALSTYAELKTSIGDWLNRADLTAVIPDFISLAEAQVERTLRTRQIPQAHKHKPTDPVGVFEH